MCHKSDIGLHALRVRVFGGRVSGFVREQFAKAAPISMWALIKCLAASGEDV